VGNVEDLLEASTITLPLNEVLEVLRVALGQTAVDVSTETEILMKLEVISSLCDVEGLEDEDRARIVAETFGDPLGFAEA